MHDAALRVDAGGLKPNTWQRFERLGTAWEQAKLGLGDEPQSATEGYTNVVANPRRRARTPLTNTQVDAIRTARAGGESVVSICRPYGVHRMKVDAYEGLAVVIDAAASSTHQDRAGQTHLPCVTVGVNRVEAMLRRP